MQVSKRKKATDGLKSGFLHGQVNSLLSLHSSTGLTIVAVYSIKSVILIKPTSIRLGNL